MVQFAHNNGWNAISLRAGFSAELAQRLKERAQDAEDVLSQRMAQSTDEITHWPEYDYVIVNDDIEIATNQIGQILSAERLRRHRRTGLSKFVEKITEDNI